MLARVCMHGKITRSCRGCFYVIDLIGSWFQSCFESYPVLFLSVCICFISFPTFCPSFFICLFIKGWIIFDRLDTLVLSFFSSISSSCMHACILPLGYNFELDKLLQNKEIKFARMYCLKRISMDNKWIEVDWKDVQNSRFNSSFPAANGLVIGIIEKDTTENFFDKHY